MSKNDYSSRESCADPLSVVRGWPIKKIPLNKIKSKENFVYDEIFQNKYIGYLRGKLTAYATREPIINIKPGFFKPKKPDGGFDYIIDEVDSSHISAMSYLIQRGDRQPLYIYKNPNKSDPHHYVCPDDVSTYFAYQNLGIEIVPVVLLDNPSDIKESAIGIKTIISSKIGPISYMSNTVGVTHDLAPSFFELDRPEDATSIDRIIEAVDFARNKVRNFHRGGDEVMHYHHTLHSVLLRVRESLVSIKILFENGLHLNSISILRSLYELALTFYVDWLAPTEMYRYLQLASVVNQKKWEERCKNMYKDEVKRRELSEQDAKLLTDGHIRAYRLASVISEKARIFPFGIDHHRDIYEFLSDITHHDFSMIARYTYTLEHGDSAVFVEDAKRTVIHFADLLSASIVTRILGDTGVIDNPSP